MSTTTSVQEGDLEHQPTDFESDRDLMPNTDKADGDPVNLDRESSSTSSSGVIGLDDIGVNTQTMQSVESSSALPQFSTYLDSDDAKLQQARVARIVAEEDFESLQEFGGVQVIAEALGTNLQNGLNSEEQDLRWRRQAISVPLTRLPTRSFFRRLRNACNDYTVCLLVLAAGLSLSFGIDGMPNAIRDGFITIAVIIAIVVQNYLELDISKISGQRKLSEVPQKVIVKRGEQEEVSCSDVLVGDIIFLERDCLVPADGLFFEYGESLALELDDGSTVDANQPFLFYGAKVIDGSGGMLVTSGDSGTTLEHLMSQVSRDPGKTPLPAELDKVITILHIIGLLISLLILTVLFLRLKLGNEDVSSKLSQFKGKPSPYKDAIKGIFMKSTGKFSTLISTLTMSLLGVKGGIPYVITRYIDYWRNKMLSDKALAQAPLAWITMASASTICIDITAWLRVDQPTGDMEALKNTGLNLILVSEDKAPRLEALGFESSGRVLHLENFRNYSTEEGMNETDNISVIEYCSPSDKLLLMQHLKEKGKKVVMVGGKRSEIPALKEADVGIVMENCSSEMARESSDIIIRDLSISFLLTIIRCGRCTYHNLRKYIQFELAKTIAGLLIPTITTMSFGYSPISVIQLLWANSVLTFLGGLALMTEPPPKEQINYITLRQTEPFITMAMWRNVVSEALYQTAISVFFQSEGQALLHIGKKVSDTIIFNTFVLCQVFNIVNARELDKKNVFTDIHRNLRLWVALGVIVVLQAAFIEISHLLMGTENLSWEQWLVCLLMGMILLATDWATKCTSGFILDGFAGTFASRVGTVGMTSSAPLASASNVELQLINGNTEMSCLGGIRGNDSV